MSKKVYNETKQALLNKLGIAASEARERVSKMSRRDRAKLLQMAREVLKENNTLPASTEK